MTATGRATVLNVNRVTADDADRVLRELGEAGRDWRSPPSDLSEEEWAVLYDRTDELTPQKVKRRLASANEKLNGTFEEWRLPAPT